MKTGAWRCLALALALALSSGHAQDVTAPFFDDCRWNQKTYPWTHTCCKHYYLESAKSACLEMQYWANNATLHYRMTTDDGVWLNQYYSTHSSPTACATWPTSPALKLCLVTTREDPRFCFEAKIKVLYLKPAALRLGCYDATATGPPL